MRLDSSGNLGLGVTPSGSWEPTVKAIQISSAGQYLASGSVSFSGANQFWLGNNGYLNSSGQWIYLRSVGASQYRQIDNEHAWFTAPSGTAGNAITFTQAMTLDASGRLLVAATSSISSAYQLQVGGPFQSVSSSLISVTDTATVYRGTPDGTGFEHAKVYSGRDTSAFTYGSYLAFYTEGKSSGATDTSTERARIDSSGNLLVGLTTATGVAKLQVSGPIQTTGYTVATLPAGTVGMRTYVTDALAPSFGVAVAGSGAVTIPVFYNGANWIVA